MQVGSRKLHLFEEWVVGGAFGCGGDVGAVGDGDGDWEAGTVFYWLVLVVWLAERVGFVGSVQWNFVVLGEVGYSVVLISRAGSRLVYMLIGMQFCARLQFFVHSRRVIVAGK